MDAAYLHFLAGRICDWLAFKHQIKLKHSHALDCVAALAGLRNWPEVLAFPQRLAALRPQDAGSDAEQRVMERINGKVGHALAADDLPSHDIRYLLMEAWSQPMPSADLWPDGPPNGVYVTTSKEAAKAAVARYESAYPSTVMYAEDASFHEEGMVALGEGGIFSGGMQRVPSGTLFVLGPLVLSEENWSECRDRMAAAIALPGRVIVIVETPQPEHVMDDLMLLLHEEVELFRFEEALCRLRGIVQKDGSLVDKSPLGLGRRRPKPVAVTPAEPLPKPLAAALQAGLARRNFGFVVVGTFADKEESFRLLEATLPYTDHAGPAARILTDDRIGYDGDPPLSGAFAALPVYPSVESAYRCGYRRMVIERPHIAADSLYRHADDVCFHLPGLDWRAGELLLRSLDMHLERGPGPLAKAIAALGVGHIEGKNGTFTLFDAMPATAAPLAADAESEAVLRFADSNRSVRWEDQLVPLLREKRITAAEVKKSLPNVNLQAVG